MEKLLNKIIEVEKLNAQNKIIFELLKKYGNKLPIDIQEDMRVYTSDIFEESQNIRRSIKKIV